MEQLVLHEFHQALGAQFGRLNATELVEDYGDVVAEETAFHENAGLLDFSFRSRLCLTGSDRVRFLHGQVTNDVKKLRVWEGCYAALVTAKGRMESDLNIYCLADEVLMDFEPGLTARVTERLERFIVADDVQLVNVAPHYGLFSVQGPRSADVIRELRLFSELPVQPFGSIKTTDPSLGEIYLAKNSRLGSDGFDLFVPTTALSDIAGKLVTGGKSIGARVCGWRAFESSRVEAGVPRFGMDMDETNLPQETGIEARAVSYSKGCYIGQEILNRVHTVGHVNRNLVGLELAEDLKELPGKGDKLMFEGREVGTVTSTVRSARRKRNLGLAYVRREVRKPGSILAVRSSSGETTARLAELPFKLE
jgi:folate-binding protein YgfZ